MRKKYSAVTLVMIMCFAAALIVTSCGNGEVKRFIYDPGDAFVTNVEGTKYLLKSDILIEISDPKNEKILESESVQADIRSIIIEILRSTSYDDIMSVDAQDMIASRIKQEIEEQIQISYVENIYFNEFVVQH